MPTVRPRCLLMKWGRLGRFGDRREMDFANFIGSTIGGPWNGNQSVGLLPSPLQIDRGHCLMFLHLSLLHLEQCSRVISVLGSGVWVISSKNYFSLLSRYQYHERLEFARPKRSVAPHSLPCDERSPGLSPRQIRALLVGLRIGNVPSI